MIDLLMERLLGNGFTEPFLGDGETLDRILHTEIPLSSLIRGYTFRGFSISCFVPACQSGDIDYVLNMKSVAGSIIEIPRTPAGNKPGRGSLREDTAGYMEIGLQAVPVFQSCNQANPITYGYNNYRNAKHRREAVKFLNFLLGRRASVF